MIDQQIPKTEQEKMHQLESEYTARAVLGGRMGQQYSGKRDVYKQAGYPGENELQFSDFKGRFKRHDIAQRLVTCFPDATWEQVPEIKENEKKEKTDFELKIDEISKKIRIFHYMHRADILSCIGEFSVILLGFDDISQADQLPNPVSDAKELVYMQVYSQENVKVSTQYTDVTSSKFGAPETYEITVRSVADGNASQKLHVHESRIIHIAEGMVENDYYGPSCLESVYNRLIDLDKILASAAEGFWRSAWPGLAANKQPEYRWTPEAEASVQEQFSKYAHGLSRVMRLEGVDVQELAASPSSPSDHVQTNLQLIAGARRIPYRILIGSEQGEMASTQDRENWHNRVMERRHNWAIPVVLEQFIRKLNEAGVVTAPSSGYTIRWPRKQHTEREQTEISRKKADIVGTYAKNPGTEAVVSHYDFLTKILNFPHDEALEMMERAEGEEWFTEPEEEEEEE